MKEEKKRIIITADDFGMCEEVNAAIIEGIQNNVISSTNVLTNLYFFDGLRNIDRSKVSIGIHFNLTDGRPTLKITEVPSLIDENGNFFGLVEFKKRVHKGQIREQDIVKELKNQLYRFECVYGKPDYWNSHENFALQFGMFRIINNVVREHGLLSTRSFCRVYTDFGILSTKRKIREKIVAVYMSILQLQQKMHGYRNPDGRFIFFNLKNKYNIDSVMCAMKKTNKNIVEFVVHPAKRERQDLFGNISDSRTSDYQFVARNEFKDAISKNHFLICKFNKQCLS